MDKEIQILLLNLILFFTFLLILITTLYVVGDILSARSYCVSLNETYSLKNFQHYCNDSLISRYSNGWDFENNRDLLSRVNLSELVLPLER